jgi:ribosome-interacting GTPase 1
MPTNLPAEYYDAEEHYRQATTLEEKVERLEKMISTIPKHKGTDHLRADLRRKLSELKKARSTPKATSRHESVYNIDREGAGQVVVIGPPNTGKSSLVDALTNATPEVALFPFTTWEPTPGMMQVQDVQIQLIDTPPLSTEHIEPQMMDLIQRADLALLVIDLQASPFDQLEESDALLLDHRILLYWPERLVPTEHHVTRVPVQVVVNKVDDEALDEDYTVFCELLEKPWPLLPLSIANERYLDQFKQSVFDRLQIMRVYSKPPGKEADMQSPFVLKKGSTVEQFAAKVHRDFLEKLKAARVWGAGVYDGQMVSRDHVLSDGDIVELRT